MTESAITTLHNFSENEKDVYGRLIFAKYGEMRFNMIRMMDEAVSEAKQIYPHTSFVVHDINQGTHSPGSQHYLGRAIDGHFVGLPLNVQFLLMLKAGFKGVGAYITGVWNNAGVHGDTRQQDRVSMWIGFKKDKRGVITYTSDFNEIMRYLF